MSQILSKIEWYPNKGRADVEEITDWKRLNYTKNSSNVANVCEITLVNAVNKVTTDSKTINKYVSNDGLLRFEEEDFIKVFIRHSTTTGSITATDTSDDLVFAGEVSEIVTEVADKKSTIKLKCVDKTFTILNRIWWYDYNSATLATSRAPNIIQHIIRSTTGETTSSQGVNTSGTIADYKDGGFDIDARFVSAGGFIEDTRQPVGAGVASPNFPDITMALQAKPVYDWLLELSQIEKTNSTTEIAAGTNPQKRSMIFYVDQINRLHWFYPRDGATTTLSAGLAAGVTTGVPVLNTADFPTDGTLYINAEEIAYTGKSSTNLGSTTVSRVKKFQSCSVHLVWGCCLYTSEE